MRPVECPPDARGGRDLRLPEGGGGTRTLRLLGCSMLALALAASGCAERPAARPRIVVAAVRQPATALFFVAASLGCFRAEGLDVEEQTFELGRDALALLQRGGADAAISFETPLLRAAFTDARLRVLTALHTSTRNTRLIARREARIGAFADLEGKRIGHAAGTNADFFADLALRLGGIPPYRVTMVNAPPEASVQALAAGDLDAAVLSDPHAGEAERLLGPAAVVLGTELYEEFSMLVTREDLLAERGPALRALLRGLACGERHAREHPDDARARIAARFPEQDEATLRAQLGRVSWGLGLDHVLVDVLRREREALGAAGVSGTPPPIRRLLAPRLLEEVEPEAVMLLTSQGGAPW